MTALRVIIVVAALAAGTAFALYVPYYDSCGLFGGDIYTRPGSPPRDCADPPALDWSTIVVEYAALAACVALLLFGVRTRANRFQRVLSLFGALGTMGLLVYLPPYHDFLGSVTWFLIACGCVVLLLISVTSEIVRRTKDRRPKSITALRPFPHSPDN